MTDQSSGGLILEVIAGAALVGVIPAMIAQKKGHNFAAWWFFGAMMFIFALPAALILKPNQHQSSKRSKPLADKYKTWGPEHESRPIPEEDAQ
jgi:hypothetical protein